MREQFNIYFIWVQSKLIVQFQEQFPHADEPLFTWKLYLRQATLLGLFSKSGCDMITHHWIVLEANSPGNIGIERHRFCRSYGEVEEIVDHLICSCLTVSKGSLKTLGSAYLLKFTDLTCNIQATQRKKWQVLLQSVMISGLPTLSFRRPACLRFEGMNF